MPADATKYKVNETNYARSTSCDNNKKTRMYNVHFNVQLQVFRLVQDNRGIISDVSK